MSGQWLNRGFDRGMQLSESEKKALEQAKKIEKRWPKTRWIALAVGVGWVSVGISNIATSTNIPLAGFVLLGFGIPQCILILKIWNGRPTLRLLIKFAEINEENSN
jgi:hypothetical protein